MLTNDKCATHSSSAEGNDLEAAPDTSSDPELERSGVAGYPRLDDSPTVPGTQGQKYEGLQVLYQVIGALAPRRGNPRIHSKKQIAQIADSIRQFGFTNPVLVDESNGVIAGHGRIEAARVLGLDEVPTICLNNLSEAAIRAYVIADNRLAENAGWDAQLLEIEFHYLTELDLDFDMTITGFETGEIDFILEKADPDEDPRVEVPEVDRFLDPATEHGDLWLLGRHRVYCGDATSPGACEQLMAGEKAQMVFIDPPWNVPIPGHVSGLGSVRHENFVMASGEMSSAEFVQFLSRAFEQLVACSEDGAIHYVCIDWRHLNEILAAGAMYSELKNVCVWAKDNGGMGALYRSQHEFVFVFKSGTSPHINNIELGRHGRYRTNIWQYPGVNTLREGRLEELAMHPTVKPVALVADAILDCSHRNGVVLDSFGGSGTTVIAAERTGRRARVLELDPRYVDVTLKRYLAQTGIEPMHATIGLSFSELAEIRRRALNDGHRSIPMLPPPRDHETDRGGKSHER